MHRVNWDFVSPTSWLGSLVDEELVMGDDTPAATTIYFIPMGQRRGEDEPMQSTGEDEETMEGVAGEGDENEDKDKDEDTEESLDDDFFHDLPMGTRALETQMPANLTPPQQKTKDGYSYFTYSYSRCGTLDDNADLVHSTRRRYEDSAGHLKAVHSRRIGNRTLESMWKKRSEDDEGLHDVKVSIGDVDTFKKAWENTPFGKAEAQARAHREKHQTQYPDETPAKEIP